MNKKELGKFKTLLLEKREELISNMNHITEDARRKSQKEAAGDLSSYGLHMADVASDNFDREFLLGLASGERKTLLEIEEAFRRIQEKSYGKCLSCKKKISKRRLSAVPYARFCLPCQRKEEEKR